jgi:hypothetical protein
MRFPGPVSVPSGFDRGGDERRATMAYAALGHDISGELFDLLGLSPQYRNFHAANVVEYHAHRRNQQIMVILKSLGQSLAQIAL